MKIAPGSTIQGSRWPEPINVQVTVTNQDYQTAGWFNVR